MRSGNGNWMKDEILIHDNIAVCICDPDSQTQTRTLPLDHKGYIDIHVVPTYGLLVQVHPKCSLDRQNP